MEFSFVPGKSRLLVATCRMTAFMACGKNENTCQSVGSLKNRHSCADTHTLASHVVNLNKSTYLKVFLSFLHKKISKTDPRIIGNCLYLSMSLRPCINSEVSLKMPPVNVNCFKGETERGIIY
jgi:hypothetical protein